MPNPKDSNYVIKPFMLNLDKPDELALYEWLKGQPRHRFKQETKAYWLQKMKEEKNEISL